MEMQALPIRDTQDQRGDAWSSESSQRLKNDSGYRSEFDTPGCLAGTLNYLLLSVFRLSLASARTYRSRKVKQARGEEKGLMKDFSWTQRLLFP